MSTNRGKAGKKSAYTTSVNITAELIYRAKIKMHLLALS